MSSFRTFILSLVLSLLLGEILVRAISTQSMDGETWVSSALLRPYRLPVVSVPESLEHYQRSGTIRVVYDSQLGWAPSPNGIFEDGRYRYNAAGIRDEREFGPSPASGTLRIALFGDSFVHGDDVTGEETLASHLERALRESGVKAEVLNFGVSAYGMDQALLRWRVMGQHFHPHAVIAGLQPENVKRNLNLHRYFYTHRGDEIPFTKPRFELHSGELTLVNSPTVPLEEIAEFMRTFPSQDLRSKEFFYNPEDFIDRWWYRSEFVALIFSFVLSSNKYVYEARERFFYDPYGAPGRLGLAILTAFEREVESSGSRFFTLFIPRLRHLASSQNQQALPYEGLLNEIANRFPLIDPRPNLLQRGTPELSSLYTGEVHFSSEGNAALAQAALPFMTGITAQKQAR